MFAFYFNQYFTVVVITVLVLVLGGIVLITSLHQCRFFETQCSIRLLPMAPSVSAVRVRKRLVIS